VPHYYAERATIDSRLTLILLQEVCDAVTTPHADTRSQLDHINRFLAELYQDIQRLSDLLHKMGVRDAAIAALRGQHLSSYVSRLSQRWQTFITDALPERHADIVIRRYALNGQLPPRLADLGVEYGISRERVRQLEQAGLKRLRSRKRRKLLQQIALEVAYEITGLPPEEMLKPIDVSRESSPSDVMDVDDTAAEQDLETVAHEQTGSEESLADQEAKLPEYVIVARQRHPKAYARWTIEEDNRLRELYSSGMDITALAPVLERQPSAIRARLTKLGLLPPR
jgi:hypothetical protein